MNILVYLTKPNYRYESLIEPIRHTGQNVGFVTGDLNKEDFYRFNPDIVIHDIPNVDRFPADGKFVSINLNETKSTNSFSIMEGSANYIEPFAVLRTDAEYLNKYSSDLLYIGDPTVFGDILPELINRNLKILHNTTIPIMGYSGLCGNDYHKFYKHAKISIVHKDSDLYRIRDILVAGGIPVVYNDSKDFLERIDMKIPFDKESRESVVKSHTNYDRASFIFRKIGLEKMSKMIAQAKDKI